MQIISITNQKGGVGKTTTAINLSACLAERGKRILLIDLDPQANATSGLGIDPVPGNTIYGPLLGGGTLESRIRTTDYRNLSIIPSDMELAGCEVELAQQGNHLTRIRDVLHPLRESRQFDYAILDTPPSLGLIMTAALAAADQLFIPLQCEYFGLEGLSKIVHIVNEIAQSDANPGIMIEGILMTMFDARTRLANQVVEDVRSHFQDTVYNTIIPRTIRLGEAPSFGQPIIYHDASGLGAFAYRALAEEFLARRNDLPEDSPPLPQPPEEEESASWLG